MTKRSPPRRIAKTDGEFWDWFYRDCWARRAGVFRSPAVPALTDAPGVFRALRGAARDLAKGALPAVRVMIGRPTTGDTQEWLSRERTALDQRFAQYLPTDRDANLAGYLERLAGEADGLPVAVILNHYTRHDAHEWLRVYSFLGNVLPRTGIPATGTVPDIFIGNYQATPFGVHRDEQGVFTWCINGYKRFLVWPASSFSGETRRYEAQRETGERLELNESDDQFSFWPASFWHIAESDGSDFTVTASVGIREIAPQELRRSMEALTKAALAEAVRMARPSDGGEEAFLPWHTGGSSDLDPNLASAMSLLQRAVAKQDHLIGMVQRQTLSVRSSLGLGPIPLDPGLASTSEAEPVRLRSPTSLMWHKCADNRFIVAVHGHVFELDVSEAVIAWLAVLAGGTARTLSSWQQLLVRRGVTKPDARDLLEMLVAHGAFTSPSAAPRAATAP